MLALLKLHSGIRNREVTVSLSVLSSLRDTDITFLKKVIYLWPCWVFVAVSGVSLLAASKGYSSLPCVGFPLQWLLFLQHIGLWAL